MKVHFRNDHTIFRVPIDVMTKVVMTIVSNKGDENEAVEKLKTMGWSSEELKRFDDEWIKNQGTLEYSDLTDATDLYKEIMKRIDLNQFWCMK